MLVLISDLHLTDEHTARNVSHEAFDVVVSLVRDTAQKRRAKELHLVLLGDILDLVRTDYWHRKVPAGRRPWGGRLDPRTAMNADSAAVESQFAQVLSDITATRTARALAGAMGALANGPVPFKATYVVGNHDRVLWNFPALQQQVKQSFPQITAVRHRLESTEYAVLARHGHEWDVNTHGWQFRERVLRPDPAVDRFAPEAYEVMAIGEVITAELMSGLIYYVREGGMPAAVVEQLLDVNNLRPLPDVFEWLEWFGEGRGQAHQRILYEALRQALEGVLESSLAGEWDRLRRDVIVSADLVDRLQQARDILLGANFGSFRGRVEAFRRLQQVFARIFGEEEDRLLKGAWSEEVFQARNEAKGIQRVIYGHTHRPRHDYLSGYRDGRVKMYVNTGTYLPLITRAADQRSFASSIQMTLVYLYREDEDLDGKLAGTSSMDIWNGVRRKVYA
jgi:UDP-2,3-diacylglucosamine pyrophosphatase LpxH